MNDISLVRDDSVKVFDPSNYKSAEEKTNINKIIPSSGAHAKKLHASHSIDAN